MSERLAVCRALAAMMRKHGAPAEEEVTFVAHAAFELGLDSKETAEVQSVLKDGGSFEDAIAAVESHAMRVFLFRRVVAATLIDDHISAAERAFIDAAAKRFAFAPEQVEHFIDWMKEGIRWERRGAELMARL